MLVGPVIFPLVAFPLVILPSMVIFVMLVMLVSGVPCFVRLLSSNLQLQACLTLLQELE